MAQVTLRINGYAHSVACADGEEEHLKAMGAELDQRVTALRQAGLAGSETRMLILTALQLADELADAKQTPGGATAPASGSVLDPTPGPAPEFAASMAALAERIARVAGRLESAALGNAALETAARED